ncbi:MAG: hypothetical protein HY747_10385 [Elusimicrobia bacterium]|nr:hypothetical protein [Elusimicrobiota bacterium]
MRSEMKEKEETKKLNCWEFKKCGREPGGANVESMGICPASTEKSCDGFNGGKNGGRICWAAAGTFCGGKVQGIFAKKVSVCLECNFFQQVVKEEGGKQNFKFLLPGLELQAVKHLLEEIIAAKDYTDNINQQLRASEQQLKAANQQLGAKEQALRSKMSDLEKFNRLIVGRELRMVELKAEVNSLLEKSGQPGKYEAPWKIKTKDEG